MNAKQYLDRAVLALNDTANGRQYEFGIAGYEFDGPMEDKEGVRWDPEYDGNWLNVSFRVKDNERDTSCLDACLLTWELEHLADDIEYFLSHAGEKEFEPWFTENVLWLGFRRLAEGKVAFGMHFTSEGKMTEDKKWETFHFSGVFSEREIRRAVKALRIFSAAFPYRQFEDNRKEGTSWLA